MEQIDPQAEIDRYIAQISCEICGRHTDIVGEFTEKWYGRTKRHAGYTSKHWRKWRACVYCFNIHGGNSAGLFENWIFTIIRSVVINLDFMQAIMPLQPMPGPTANVFYLDRTSEPNSSGEISMDYRHVTSALKYQLQPDYEQEAERIEYVRQTAWASATALMTALQGVNIQAPATQPSIANV